MSHRPDAPKHLRLRETRLDRSAAVGTGVDGTLGYARERSMGSVRRAVPIGIALLAGLVAVFALPPYSMLPIAPVAFGAIYWLVRRSSPQASFAYGWLFGLGFFGAGLFWISESFQVDADRFGALAAPAVGGLSAFLALFPALACSLVAILGKTRISAGPGLAVIFAAAWVLSEWLRGHLLTGFPWNLAAYALVDYASLRQSVAWFASYGVSFLVVLAAVLPVQALVLRGSDRWVSAVLFLLIIGGSWSGGMWQLKRPEPVGADVSLRIVQANVPQEDKWRPENRALTLT